MAFLKAITNNDVFIKTNLADKYNCVKTINTDINFP